MDYTHNTFLLSELVFLKEFMEDNQAPTITFGDKIIDWPRAEVLNLLTKYELAKQELTCTSHPHEAGVIEKTRSNKPTPTPTFELELTRLINKHSLENQSNTPDFILAEYLVASLEAFNYSVKDFDSERADETHANTMEEVFSSTCDQRAAWNA